MQNSDVLETVEAIAINLLQAGTPVRLELVPERMRYFLGAVKEIEEETEEDARAKNMKAGITRFNQEPRKGCEWMQERGLIGPHVQDVVEFLLHNEQLKKEAVGEYLGEGREYHVKVLEQFVAKLEFDGMEFDIALRRFLLRFRLPGEAQKIDRIMEQFAQQYWKSNPGLDMFANSDAVYLLAFSTIMLNTDAHNPQIKNKMTKAQFVFNNETINNGKPLPRGFMETLYDKIVNEEIKMESPGQMFINAEKKGWLTKQGGRIKTWKRRWFILSDNVLFYFKTPQDPEPCGMIPLENLDVEAVKDRKECRFTLSARVGSELKSAKRSEGSLVKGHHKVYLIEAANPNERDAWMKAITSNIYRNPFYDLVAPKIKTKK